MIKIGSYVLPSNVLLAPMSGITDLPYRLICREHGAKLAFFEMIDCNSMIFGKKYENKILRTVPNDTPIAAQLVGTDPENMLKAAEKLAEMRDIKFLDINAACPVPKIVKKKAGAYLIKEPENLYKTIELLSSKLAIPVTVKLRSGYSVMGHAHIRNVSKNCEDRGAGAIFIHGRTQKQGYSGNIDLEAIREVKNAVDIPVFGSGNILNAELAKQMIDMTGCDGVMVARGSYGNPWIFKDIETHLANGKLTPKRSLEEKLGTAKKHIGYIEKYRDMEEKSKIGYMRKVAQWYTKGFPHTCGIRRMLDKTSTKEQLMAILERTPEIIRSEEASPLTC